MGWEAATIGLSCSLKPENMETHTPPYLTLVILNWNGLSLLRQCLPSVVASLGEGHEVLLVDNGSTDDSVAWTKATFPQVRVLALPENLGYAGGNNAGLRAVESPFVLVLNNDVEVAPGWLPPLLTYMEAHPKMGAVQPKLLQYTARGFFEYAGAAGGHVDRYGFPFTRGRIFETMEPDHGQYDVPEPLFWASGAAILLRKVALDQAGLFDEAFFMHMEEIDLCWRMQRHGWQIGVVPQSKAWHIGGASLPKINPFKTYLNFRNSLLMLYKNLPVAAFVRAYRGRLVLDVVAAFHALWQEPKVFPAILRAHRDFRKMRKAYTPPASSDPAVLPSYKGSIVWDYFVRGKKRFSSLNPAAFWADKT